MLKIKEAKSVGLLYHVTDSDGFLGILTNDILGKGEYVSFTRDRNYTYVAGTERYYVIQLVVDGDKLSNNYKITPYASQDKFVGGHRFEAEERVKGPIRNIGKYLLEIRSLRDKKDTNLNWVLYKKIFFDYLKKYPRINNLVYPGEKFFDLDSEITGIYSNGKRVYPATEKTFTKVLWEKLVEPYYKKDRDLYWTTKEDYLSGQWFFDLSVPSAALAGFDYVYTTAQGVFIRAQEKRYYQSIEKFAKSLGYHIEWVSYKAPMSDEEIIL